MNQFIVQLQAKLDEAKSKGNINSDISSIQNQLDKLKLQVEIDPKSISNIVKQLEVILNQKITISNIIIDQAKATKTAQQTGQQIGQTVTDSAQKTINGKSINIDKLNADVKILVNSLNSFSSKNAGFDTFKTEINGIEVSLDSLINKLSTVDKVTDLSTIRSQATALKTAFTELSQIKNIKSLSNGGIKNDYSTQLAKLEGQFRSLGLTEDEVKTKTSKVSNALETLKTRVNQPFDESNYQEIISLNDKLQKELAESSNEYTKLQSSAKGYVSIHQRLTKANTIEAWNQKNSNATKNAIANNESYIASLRNLNVQMTKMEFEQISRGFKETENSMRGINRLGASLKNQFSQATQSITRMLSVTSGVMLVVSQTKDAFSEIKELDDILTEISKTSDLTAKELKQLGAESYNTASKYGRTASDYLSGVQSMSQSGFYGEIGKGMAEQSLLAQAAGDMAQDVADKYVIATNAAYKFNGEVSKINDVLDGQNSISNRNSVALEDMATAMSEAGTVASSYNVTIENLSAMIGTMESVTKSGGSEVGNSIKSLLINLQNITSDKIVDTLNAANASMTEMVNGAEKLRNPIDILRDLAKTFNQLDEDDPLRAEILTNIGQKYHATKLGALLQNMDMFDKMLVDYSEGSGSALEEANILMSENNFLFLRQHFY